MENQKKCPNCGRPIEETPAPLSCPACGVIFSKLEELARRRKEAAQGIAVSAPPQKGDAGKIILSVVTAVIIIGVAIGLVKFVGRKAAGNPAAPAAAAADTGEPEVEEEEGPFSDSEELAGILEDINAKAKEYGIEVALKDLKSYYDRGPGMISLGHLDYDLARELGFPLPQPMQMTDEEFDKRKRYKCHFMDTGWTYLDGLPKTDKGITECYAQHYGYGKGVNAGTQIIFTARHMKIWYSRRFDAEAGRWVEWTMEEKRKARRHMLAEKASEARKQLQKRDQFRDIENSRKLLVKAMEKYKSAKSELDAFSGPEIAHYERAVKDVRFNDTDRKIAKIMGRVRGAEDRIKHALIVEREGQIQRIGFDEFLVREGIIQ